MHQNESVSESGYAGPAPNDIRHIIEKAFIDGEDNRLKRFIDNGYEKVAPALF